MATTTKATTTAGGSTSVQSAYGQCGGSGWSGPTACATGATCSSYNSYYSQCIPTAS
jgi:endoglucanase